MLLLTALAATAIAQPSAHGRELVRQATASVRIVSGERIRFGRRYRPGRGPQVIDRHVRESDGSRTLITLVEFP